MGYVYLDDSPVARFARARSTLRQSIPPPALGSPSWCCQWVDEKKGRGEFGRRALKRNPVSHQILAQKANWQDSFFFVPFFFVCSFRTRIRLEVFWQMILSSSQISLTLHFVLLQSMTLQCISTKRKNLLNLLNIVKIKEYRNKKGILLLFRSISIHNKKNLKYYIK